MIINYLTSTSFLFDGIPKVKPKMMYENKRKVNGMNSNIGLSLVKRALKQYMMKDNIGKTHNRIDRTIV